MLEALLIITCTFLVMEMLSYIMHRWLFHGVLWQIHSSHHKPRKGLWEANDIFSLTFAAISILLIFSSERTLSLIGFGIAIYGLAYFIVHDVLVHKRFFSLRTKNKVLLTIISAHQKHHQSIKKEGREPFGLFIFDYISQNRNFSKRLAKASSTFRKGIP